MQRSRFLSGLTLVGIGYILGTTFSVAPTLFAQSVRQTGYERQTIQDFQTLHSKLGEVKASLEAESKHTSAVDGNNAFAVCVGGIDALKDLEENRGVDPETFAALYAGRAHPDVFPHLGSDEKGRLTYKGNLVRMYSRERLKKLYIRRDELLRAK